MAISKSGIDYNVGVIVDLSCYENYNKKQLTGQNMVSNNDVEVFYLNKWYLSLVSYNSSLISREYYDLFDYPGSQIWRWPYNFFICFVPFK